MTPDKGDIYTLTLDHWSKRRSRQLRSFIFHIADNPQLLDYFFGNLCKKGSHVFVICMDPFLSGEVFNVVAAVTVCSQ